MARTHVFTCKLCMAFRIFDRFCVEISFCVCVGILRVVLSRQGLLGLNIPVIIWIYVLDGNPLRGKSAVNWHTWYFFDVWCAHMYRRDRKQFHKTPAVQKAGAINTRWYEYEWCTRAQTTWRCLTGTWYLVHDRPYPRCGSCRMEYLPSPSVALRSCCCCWGVHRCITGIRKRLLVRGLENGQLREILREMGRCCVVSYCT